MSKNNLSKSVKKYLRRKKSEIRRQFLDAEEAEKKIAELVREIFVKTGRKVSNEDKNKQNQQSVA